MPSNHLLLVTMANELVRVLSSSLECHELDTFWCELSLLEFETEGCGRVDTILAFEG